MKHQGIFCDEGTRMQLGQNQKITKDELALIRKLEDFDLTMFISEIHDHGWPVAKQTLEFIRGAYKKLGKDTGEA